MGHIRESSDLVAMLFDYGSTNNENLQLLLMHLKEIAESNAGDLKDEFIEIFPNLASDEGLLNSTNDMLIIFLTHLAMIAKPSKSSVSFIKSRQNEEDLLIKFKELELSLRNYSQSNF
jgi:hypothetical protein